MGVQKFDGTIDRVKWATLASPIANLPTGAWTLAILTKRVATGAYGGLSYLLSGAGDGVAEAGASFRGGAAPDVNKLILDTGNSRLSVSTFTSTSPYLIVISKAAGSAVPRVGWKIGAAGAWTHENFSDTDGDQVAATMLEIGAWQNGDFNSAWIGAVAWWSGAMSDTNKEALDNNWRTSDWYNSAHGTPVFLCQLNVAAASLVDIIGNASGLVAESGGNYPTLDASETLENWTFDGNGSSGGGGTLSAAPAEALTTTEAVTMNLKLMPQGIFN